MSSMQVGINDNEDASGIKNPFMSLGKSYLMKKITDVIDSYNKVTRYI